MKTLGVVLIMAGFVLGAVFSVLEVDSVIWPAYIGVLVIGFGGVALFKSAHRAGASDADHVEGSIGTLETALENICRNLDGLVERREGIPPHEFRFEIDRLFRDDLTAFAEARESMQHAFGLQAYADIMSAFAAGERYINRVWTASADGYIDEVLSYLEKARRQFAEARADFARERG